MDGERFDTLARVLGNAGTRRGLFRGIAGGVLAWSGLDRFAPRAASQDPAAAPSLILPVCACPPGLLLCAGLCVEPAACLAPEAPPLACIDSGGGQGTDCFTIGFQAGADAARKAITTKGISGSAQTSPDDLTAGGTPVPVTEDAALKAVKTRGDTGTGIATDAANSAAAAAAPLCPPQTQYCETKGTCVPCPTVMMLDANCRCVCPDPFHSEASVICPCPTVAHCQCVCPGPPCEFPKVQRPEDCTCVCPRGCPGGQEQDAATCRCICPRGQHLCDITGECLPCPSGQVLEPRTCRCVCEHITCGAACCPEGRVCDLTASPPACCKPRTTCPGGFCGTVSDRCGGQLACPCEPGKTCCDGDCVDTLTDREHCGRCGRECPDGGDCVDGLCPCEGGIICDGDCFEGSECCTAEDCPDLGPCQSAICGAGGGPGTPRTPRVCLYADAPDGASCPAGLCCGGTCLIGKTCCRDNQCAPPDTCQDNVCACVPARACIAGRCGTFTDNCGGQYVCGCGDGQTCCDGACVDTRNDPSHCGACGQPCEPPGSCLFGQCVQGSDPCPAGSVRCKERCVTCPPEATVSADFCDCVCETVTVPTDGSMVFSKMILASGRVFTLRASGTFDIGNGQRADAEYVFNQTGSVNACRGNEFGIAINDPRLYGPVKTPPSWGPYNTGHVYTAAFTGTGSPIGFNYRECQGAHADNTGTLTVEIVCDCSGVSCPPPTAVDPATCACVCPTTRCGRICCDPGQVCRTDTNPPTCCTPQDVCSENSCGRAPDGCGGTIDRGPCPEHVCIAGVCNETAQEVGQCNGCAYAVVPDNRPGPLCDGPGQFCCGRNCCGRGQVCTNGRCCEPFGLCAADFCGSVDNGCGGLLHCECGPGLTCCGNRCVDLQTATTDCGVCGLSCNGFSCAGGVCDELTGCPRGYQRCGGECRLCPPEATLDALCTCICPRGGVLCNGQCIDRCPTDKPLNRVTCQCGCPEGRVVCRGRCCGAGQVCNKADPLRPCCTPAPVVCPATACGPVPDGCGGTIDFGPCDEQVCQTASCQTGQDAAPGEAVSAPACGTCAYAEVPDGRQGPLCNGPGETCCGGVCTASANDRLNCGACGTRCPAGQGCADGRCGCSCPEFACLIDEWPTDCPGDNGEFWAGGVAVDRDGNVFVVDSRTGAVQRFTSEGDCQPDGRFGPASPLSQQPFTAEDGVAIGPDGLIYVADRNNHRVLVYDPRTGALLNVWGGPVGGQAVGTFGSPSGIVVAPDGTIYVADNNNHRIQFRRPGGNWQIMGDPAPIAFDYPAGIAIAPNGWIYVIEQGGNRVRYFDQNHQPLGQWGAFRQPPIDFWNPRAIAIGPDGTVYVADTENYRIQAFTPDGKPLGAWGSQATGMYALGVTVATDGTVLVAIPGGGIRRYCLSTARPLGSGIATPPSATPAGTPAATATATATAPTPEPTATPSPSPPPTATSIPTPTGSPACTADELACAGRCIPAAECPAEACCLDAETCKCICPECGPNGAFDPASCGCACTSRECPPNWGFDEATCTCVCSPSPCAPGSNWQFDQPSCSCICIPPASCPPNFVFNEESCSCVCPMTECAPNHVWDLEACTCTCVPQECPPNHVFDEALCGCVCGITGCPPNYVFDAAGCACLCAAECPPTFRFDEATCSCVCELAGCPPNFTFTPESCACYCEPPACPPGYFVDQASCTCFCPETACPEGQIFDLASCACVGSGAGSAVGESG